MNFILKISENKLISLINHKRYSIGSVDDMFEMSKKQYLLSKENDTYLFYMFGYDNNPRFNKLRHFELKFSVLQEIDGDVEISTSLILEPFLNAASIVLLSFFLIAAFFPYNPTEDIFAFICICIVLRKVIAFIFINKTKVLNQYVEELKTITMQQF
jgi:hypothetical protein